MLVLGVDLSDEDGVGRPAEPGRPEPEIPHMGEQEPERRVEGDGQAGGDQDGEVLGVGQRLEQAAFLVLEGEDRQESDGDDEQGEEARTGDEFDGPDDDVVRVLLPPVLLPLLEALVRLLDDDDRGIHQRADGDRDTAERHDVGGDPHQPEGDERQEHRDRDRDQGDDGARKMP